MPEDVSHAPADRAPSPQSSWLLASLGASRIQDALAPVARAHVIYAMQLLGTTCGYFLLGVWGLQYASLKPVVSLFWPASGFALAAILLGGVRLWPGVALGAFLVNLHSGIGVAPAAVIAGGDSLEALVAWRLLRRHFKLDVDLGHTTDVFGLVLALGAGALVAAVVGSEMYRLVHHGQSHRAWLIWWMGDTTGMLLLTPLILVWAQSLPRVPWSRWGELLVLVSGLLWVSWRAFFATRPGAAAYPAALALFPLVAWAALRFGRRGATAFALGAALLAMFGTIRGGGPFATSVSADLLLRWWEYTTTIAMASLLLATLRTERARAWLNLEQSHQQLEAEVEKHTAHLQQTYSRLQAEMAARRGLERHLVEAGEQRRRSFGQDLHDGLGQCLTGMAMMSHALTLALRERASELAPLAERLCSLAGDAQAEARRMASGLYPATLERQGLLPALQELAQLTCERSHATCVVCLSGPILPELPATRTIHLYRIVQESVHNAVRHGHAAHIRIELQGLADGLEIAVHDNGCGFDPAVAEGHSGTGFYLMRQRSAVLGADLQVQSSCSQGTVIRLHLPWPVMAAIP